MNIKQVVGAAAIALAVLPRATRAEARMMKDAVVEFEAPNVSSFAKLSDAVEVIQSNMHQLVPVYDVVSEVTGTLGALTADAGLATPAARYQQSYKNVLRDHIARNSDKYAAVGSKFASAGLTLVSEGDVVSSVILTTQGSLELLVAIADMQLSFAEAEAEKLGDLATQGLATRLQETQRRATFEAAQATTNMVHRVFSDVSQALDFIITGENSHQRASTSRDQASIADITSMLTSLNEKIARAAKAVMTPSSSSSAVPQQGEGADALTKIHDRYVRFMEVYHAVSLLVNNFGNTELYKEFGTLALANEGGNVFKNILETIQTATTDVTTAINAVETKSNNLSHKVADRYRQVFEADQTTINACKAVYAQHTVAKSGLGILSDAGTALATSTIAGVATVPWAISSVAASIEEWAAPSHHPTVRTQAESWKELSSTLTDKSAEYASNAVYRSFMAANVQYNQQSCVAGALLYNKWIRYSADQLEQSVKNSFQPMIEYVEDVSYQVSATANSAMGEGSPMVQLYEVVDTGIVTPAGQVAGLFSTTMVQTTHFLSEATQRAYNAGMTYLWSSSMSRFGDKRDMIHIMFSGESYIVKFGRAKTRRTATTTNKKKTSRRR